MSIVIAVSSTQTCYSLEVISQGGALATVSLILSLSIALLISDSKYWNSWGSSTLDTCSYPLLLTFAAIVVFKIMLII